MIVLSIIIVLLAVVSALVSPVAKSYVNKHGKELVGRELHVDKLRVNALVGRVRIYDLKLYEEDDKTVFFSFDTLDVSVKLRKLLFHELCVRHITLAEPKVRIVQDGDQFNFNSIIDHFASDSTAETDTTKSDWKLGFYKIRLSEGEVLYADKKLKNEWNLKNLNLKIPGVYFDGSENTDAGLALQLADGGVLRTEASMNMDNNDFSVKVELEKIAISNVRAYLADIMNVGRMDGELNANIKVKGNLGDIMKMIISGDLAFAGVDIRDSKDAPVVALGNLAMVVKGININDNLYDIESLTLDGLDVQYDMKENGSNFERLFAIEDDLEETVDESQDSVTKVESQSSGKAKPFNLRIGTFAINDASFTYNDYTLPDPFSFPIRKLNVRADNVSSVGDNNARITAQLPHGGMALIRWRGKIDAWKERQHLILDIKNLQLKDLSPYAVAYLGYPLTDGTFSFTSDNSIVYSQLDGRNELDLFNPEVGEKRKDVDAELKIPLKAALYVLKDKDGKVQFDVPVSGNIDSPEFSYMKIVWKTLGNLIVKVATSPFRAVAKALGQSGELDFIEYNPLHTHFDSEQYSILNKVAEVLRYDTSIVVTLEPHLCAKLAAPQQSLYLLKEEYFMSKHPEYAKSDVLPQTLFFEKVNAISLKDSGFVAFVRSKGVSSKKTGEKDIQRLAEKLYPHDAAVSSLEIVAGYRNEFVRRFFTDQGIDNSRLVISSMVIDDLRSGYVINSDVSSGDDSMED